jgi:hypothetical protein
MPWIVQAVQEVCDVPLSLDTTNLAAMEAGLKVCRDKAMLNSASADPERLDPIMQLAARYGARVIALTMGVDGIPTTSDGRVAIAMESLLPAAEAAGVPVGDVYLDPLVLDRDLQPGRRPGVGRGHPHVQDGQRSAADDHGRPVEHLQRLSRREPAAHQPHLPGDAHGGRSRQRHRRPARQRPDGVDPHRRSRDDSTPVGRLVLALYDATAAMEDFDEGLVDAGDDDQVAILKTYRMLHNRVLYADSYLRF